MLKKLSAVVLGVMMFAVVAVPAQAQTVDINALLQQIAALQAQIQALQGTTATTPATPASLPSTQNLTIGSTGADVVALQTWLESTGDLVMPAGVAKGYFDLNTQSALAKWQARYGVVPASGYYGPITRAKIQELAATGSPSITVSSPRAGQIIKPGDRITINYGLNNFPQPVRVEIQLNKGASYPQGGFNPVTQVSGYIPSTGRFDWVVPNNISPGNDYSIMVSSNYPSTETGYSGWSGNFTITATSTPSFDGNLNTYYQGQRVLTDQEISQGSVLDITLTPTPGALLDILVCTENNRCFTAYNRFYHDEVGEIRIGGIRLGTNIPVGSRAFIRVRYSDYPNILRNSTPFVVVGENVSRPTVTLSASPTSIVSDGKPGSVNLTWLSNNATYCNFEKQRLDTSGSMVVSVATTSTYSISCTGPGGTTSDSVNVVFSLTIEKPSISSVSTANDIANVRQGTNLTGINWATTGEIPRVDVLVCIQGGGCFYAHRNIVNNNSVSSVRVGTNIPVGSRVFVRVQKAGDSSIQGTTPLYEVVSSNTEQSANVLWSVQGLVDNLSSILNRE